MRHTLSHTFIVHQNISKNTSYILLHTTQPLDQCRVQFVIIVHYVRQITAHVRVDKTIIITSYVRVHEHTPSHSHPTFLPSFPLPVSLLLVILLLLILALIKTFPLRRFLFKIVNQVAPRNESRLLPNL